MRAERTARPARRLVVMLGALSAFGPLSMDMYLPGLPALTRELGSSASIGQLTLTGCMLGIAAGQLIVGPLSDALGRRRPLVAGLVGYVVASAACALAPSMGALIALRVIQGIAGGAGVVIARAIVRDLYGGALAARVFALLMMVTGVAPVLAPLVGGQVLAFTSWRGIFVLLAAIGVPLLIASLLVLPETLAPDRRHGGGLVITLRTFRRLLGDRGFSPHAVSFSLSFAAMFAYIAGSSFVLENVYGTSAQLFSVVFAVNSAALVTMSQLGGRVVERVGSGYLLRRGLIGTAAACVLALLATIVHAGLAPLLASFFVLLGANGLVLPNGTASALHDQRGALGSASALLGLGQFGSGAVIAPLVGLAGPRDPLPMAVAMAVCGVGALVVNLILAPPTRSPRAVVDRSAA
ncbi:MAG: multidrug effflux MFS transporter [Solirubrobacterales bacterium]|nr:multidrug effflux MFS transporter [Solirubrobacterales bacterium]